MAALSKRFQAALLKRLKDVSFHGCIRRPTGDCRRFAIGPFIHTGGSRERKVPILSTLNV
jgi:hypothetical protein